MKGTILIKSKVKDLAKKTHADHHNTLIKLHNRIVGASFDAHPHSKGTTAINHFTHDTSPESKIGKFHAAAEARGFKVSRAGQDKHGNTMFHYRHPKGTK